MDIYCKICEACGEEGCCPPTVCQNHKDGFYCDMYFRDLKFGYLMHQELQDYIPKKKYDEVFDKVYKLVYNKD